MASSKSSLYYTLRRESWRRTENAGAWEYLRIYTGRGEFDYSEYHRDNRNGRCYKEDDAGRLVRIGAEEYARQRERCAAVAL